MMAARDNDDIRLGELVGTEVPQRWRRVPVAGLAVDSRAVRPGFVFVALRGQDRDGLEFAAAAIAAGAVAVLHEPGADTVADSGVPHIAVEDLRRKLGVIADRFYASPSARLCVAGITGTNGKTTVARLIAVAAAEGGLACGLSGTLGFGRPGALRPSALTTPDAVALQAQLAAIADGGATHAAIEVSSHALAQHRVSGMRFDTAVFTNLSRDHLDYHGTMANYLEAKQRLLLWPGLRHAVINVDDAAGRAMASRIGASVLTAVGAADAVAGHARAVALERIESMSSGISVTLNRAGQNFVVASPLLGRFNASNLAVAFAVLTGWGMSGAAAARALEAVTAPPGRMEAFGGADRALVVVDYAHTPAALENALHALREHCRKQLWVVFGCGGERDAGKRPLMGEIAARDADRVVVTDDNPRREDAQQIIEQIVAGAGASDAGKVLAQSGRREAVARAIAAARPGDVVLIAGKGHEDYQLIGGRRIAYSDRNEVMRLVGGGQ